MVIVSFNFNRAAPSDFSWSFRKFFCLETYRSDFSLSRLWHTNRVDSCKPLSLHPTFCLHLALSYMALTNFYW